MSRLLVLSAAALLLSACAAVGPNYQRPQIALTDSYRNVPAATAVTETPRAWWTAFGDSELTRVVERAGAQNLDVAQARARVLQSRAAARLATAKLYPSGAALASVADGEQSLLSPEGEIGNHLPGFSRDYDLYDLGATASWEIDLFGGLRRGREAAVADARATLVDQEAVKISVEADAADAYLQVRAYQARLAVADSQITTQQGLVDLLTSRVDEGLAADRDVHQAQAALEGVRAGIPPLKAGLEAQLNRLDVLMGAQPGAWRAELQAPAPIPTTPLLSVADRPADLLRRRPDVIAAEQRLEAANARIGASIAEYYPKVSVTGLLGVESLDAGSLFTGNAVERQLAGGLRWRLFDFGRVDAQVAAAKGRDAEALAAYRASILKAVEDVENAFSNLAQQQAAADALSRQVDQLTAARRQAEQAYEGGVISLVEVRDTDRQLLAASDQLAQSRAGAARAAVAAYRALGGGWRGFGDRTVASAR